MSLQKEIETTFSLYNVPLRRVELTEEALGPTGAIENILSHNYPAGFCYGQARDGRWYVAVRAQHVSSIVPTPLPMVVIAHQQHLDDPSTWVCRAFNLQGTFGLIAAKMNEVLHCGAVMHEGVVEDPAHVRHTYTPF